MKELHPIFQACCTAEKSRYAMHKPFRIGKYVGATNGRICVRQIGRNASIVANRPDILSVTWDVDGRWHDIPALPAPPAFHKKPCGLCNATGTHECTCGWVHTCGACTAGFVDTSDKDPILTIGGVRFARQYLAVLVEFGISCLKIDARGRDTAPAYFSIDASPHVIEGLLMPCRADMEI